MQAQDRRRFGAPEGAQPLRYAPDLDSAAPAASTSKRLDDRSPAQVRPVCESPGHLRPGLVTEAAGSAYIEAGRTKVLVAVSDSLPCAPAELYQADPGAYGPKPTPPSAPYNPKAKLNVEVKFAPFSSGVRRYVPGKDTEASTLAATLHQSLLPSIILTALPKSQIDLFVTVLESDGWDGDVSLAVTAASVALAEAGIAMHGLVVGCCAAVLPTFDQPVLDPTRAEARHALAFAHLACMPALGTVTNLRLTGAVPPETLAPILERCSEVCALLHGVAKQALTDSLQRR
ncbi:SPOSA6832_01963 [Sporobolomyces salmonicolor]|uniref:SPOSA6832_01963-mRNA-1:cds n=1 Tax=Sporidiobolus salmonicolor TaxID=5005 RepID=A0A0D6EK25_SPOSA|nr:SPOSA6832_01963 [Sporobolomyces salmonicolor]